MEVIFWVIGMLNQKISSIRDIYVCIHYQEKVILLVIYIHFQGKSFFVFSFLTFYLWEFDNLNIE